MSAVWRVSCGAIDHNDCPLFLLRMKFEGYSEICRVPLPW
jgi:hypothetical protein